MALVSCSECRKDVSDKAAACPNCGAPVEDRAPVAEPEKGGGRIKVIGIVAAVIIGGFLYQSATREDRQRATARDAAAQAAAPMSSLDALLFCQNALKRVARDPEKASIPYVEDLGSGMESYFAWGAQTKMARMRNGLGLEVATSASCVVDRASKRITALTVDGKSIL